jgi:hypothetical protein
MSNVIEFLERMGRDAALRDSTSGELEQALLRADVAAPARAAILNSNWKSLESLLGAQANVCCAIHLPDDDEDEDEEGEEDEHPGKEPLEVALR